MQPHGHILDATNKVIGQPLHIADHLDMVKPLHDFLPENAQLHLRQPIAHTTMHTEAEGYVGPGILTIND